MIMASVHWKDDREHTYSLGFEACPRTGELVEINGKWYEVTQVKHINQRIVLDTKLSDYIGRD
jgi:hypothetical protein